MDGLIQSVNNITEVLKNGTPAWLSTIGAFIPILLSIVTICLSCRMDKNSKKLQKMIHNRDVYLQSRQDILSIYDAFSEAQIILCKYGTVEMAFANENIAFTWCQEIDNRHIEINKACNKAKLLFNDKELTKHLDSLCDTFQQIRDCVSRYMYNNTYLQVLQEARTSVSRQFGILSNDVACIMQNTAAREQLYKLCKNENTKEIAMHIESFLQLTNDELFDQKFRKYLTIVELSE